MLTLAGKPLAVPVLQGGMGVGVSLGGLAGAVAACGGMGCISTADTGYREPDFARDPCAANLRALNTPLVQALAEGKRFPPKHCARCLKTCDPAAVPYCITHALIEAVKGNVEEGLFFCGENVGRLDRMRTVRELMDELVTEWRQNL